MDQPEDTGSSFLGVLTLEAVDESLAEYLKDFLHSKIEQVWSSSRRLPFDNISDVFLNSYPFRYNGSKMSVSLTYLSRNLSTPTISWVWTSSPMKSQPWPSWKNVSNTFWKMLPTGSRSAFKNRGIFLGLGLKIRMKTWSQSQPGTCEMENRK